ncbi:hypothetical protein [Aeromonas sp. FDAARGOS 1408]|uniref:phage head spike fiber domain-containing protein n=1 Tax=Aeromonas TaxID=642 RepID=UPI001C237CEA|nr:hypothetical protein [Aeromonas sp. FDAARGOS 1408]QXC08725.1 hypothetical protein I6L38_01910 [Aeromonas sp. FDAARGOS 1408]
MAVNDKDPTEAILLVEQTIGTFNQIVVGQEGQMVPVPGYPDQPTLAERVKQNLKPSTDAAAGFAAQAASSAKAADDSAKLASQISGLETVADAIGLTALPLPDVWAPLSDSLRLITGYGRDVLVGSDVVARMVNFSRNSTATYIGKDGLLKTAAANEPRFEKEGLLIEGQSTNLTQRSEDWDFFNHVTGGTTVKTATEQNPYGASSQIKSAVCAIANSNVSLVGAPQDMTGVKSLSVFFNIKVAPSGFFVYVASASDKVTISPAGEISSVASGLTATVKPVGGAGWRRLTISTGIAVSRFSFNLPNVSDEIAFWGVQTEALPFASSYIPTAGAAATRAKESLYLAPSGNVPSDINMAFAAQIKLMGKGLNSWPRVFEISDPANKGPFIDMTTGMWGGANLVGVRKTVAARFSDTSRWLDGVNLGSAWQPYPVKTYSDPVYIAGSNAVGSRDFYGHVRNVRAWFFSPTDDQMKAIR